MKLYYKFHHLFVLILSKASCKYVFYHYYFTHFLTRVRLVLNISVRLTKKKLPTVNDYYVCLYSVIKTNTKESAKDFFYFLLLL